MTIKDLMFIGAIGVSAITAGCAPITKNTEYSATKKAFACNDKNCDIEYIGHSSNGYCLIHKPRFKHGKVEPRKVKRAPSSKMVVTYTNSGAIYTYYDEYGNIVSQDIVHSYGNQTTVETYDY